MLQRGREEKRQSHLRFIQRNLDFLLAAGWAGYEQHGRGAILVDADRAVEDPQWEGGITPGQYITRKMLGAAGMDWPDSDIKRMVYDYEPKREVVVAIFGGSDADYYRFGGSGRTPKEAWEKVGAQLQEMELQPGDLEKWSKGGGR